MKNKHLIFSIAAAAAIATGCNPGDSSRLWLQDGGAVPQLTGEPYYEYRILDHWDNLDDSVERGYAGKSIWEWTGESLPVDRIRQYGRLNQSIGINGTVLNNVNASPLILDEAHLKRVAEIADILRGYGMKVYLSVNFASPQALGGLSTSDPLAGEVISWWREKVDRIYALVPDFGGFLVKACSEGQPGPQDFGRSHADGANMLADALAPHGGIVMWRAFVYAPDSPDRAKQAVEEFVPLDGEFRNNVIVQIKNGPVDFQPREPVSPLFWAMKRTEVMPEVQITQEYLGQENHLCFLAPMWKEMSDTLDSYGMGRMKAIAGVANTGSDDNWCGHDFAQANWYAFGRLAWDPTLSSGQIAEEWLRLSFPKPFWCSQKRFDEHFIAPVKEMMLASREAVVDYMMPLGLHHIFAADHHYGPGPWYAPRGLRADWTPPYYHQASKDGVGFDRSRSGSDAVDQYPSALADEYDDVRTCPDELLLWFHHLPWDYTMRSGRTLWDEICLHYEKGVREADSFVETWDGVKAYVDRDRWNAVAEKLRIQAREARIWKDACLQYFQQFSGMELPSGVEGFGLPLDSLKKLDLRHTNQ